MRAHFSLSEGHKLTSHAGQYFAIARLLSSLDFLPETKGARQNPEDKSTTALGLSGSGMRSFDEFEIA
jgi:hypothetical protein